MILMHVNDSFFWVVSGFTMMEVGTAYRTLTVTMAVIGLIVFPGVALLGALLGFASCPDHDIILALCPI